MVITLGTLLFIRVKLKVFLILIPVAVLAAWFLIPAFILSYLLTALKVRNLVKRDEDTSDQSGMGSEEQRELVE